MKAVIAILLSLFALQAAAQPKESDTWFHYYSDGRAVAKRDSLYGFIDRNGVEVIPCQYQKAYNFNDGIAMVRHNFEVFAIDTLGNRLDRKVRIPKFRGQEFEGFVYWVWRRFPFTSSDEYAQLRNQTANVVITIGKDGRITDCEKADDSPESIFWKVHEIVMDSPAWTPGEVDGKPVEIRYLLPIEFGHFRPLKCRPIDAEGRYMGGNLVYPLFRNGYAYNFYGWFFGNLRFRNSNEYQRAASRRVRAAFTVDTKGSVRDIEILSFHNEVCRKKTVELLKKSPRWIPGTVDGQPVAVRYELTFNFRFR